MNKRKESFFLNKMNFLKLNKIVSGFPIRRNAASVSRFWQRYQKGKLNITQDALQHDYEGIS